MTSHKPWLLPIIFAGIMFLSSSVFAAPTSNKASDEPLQKTLWAARTELFMEYDPPVKGRLGGFLLYLTVLPEFKPLLEGRIILSLTSKEGQSVKSNVKYTGKPGIFRGALAPKSVGPHSFALTVETASFSDSLVFDGLVVSEEKSAPKHPEHDLQECETGISFLKEQQWSIEFGVQKPEKREMASQIVVTGELTAVSNAESVISTPLAGILSFDRSVPYLGQRVKKGEEMAHIESPIQQDGGIEQLSARVAEANSRVLLAQKEHDRAKRLYEAKAAPLKRLEEAEVVLQAAKAALLPLTNAMGRVKSGLSCHHLVLKSPMDGTVMEVNVSNGAFVQAGQQLIRIIDPSRLWLKANIPVAEATHLDHLASMYFFVSGIPNEFRPLRLLIVSDLVDQKTRTVQAVFEVDNRERLLKVGMFANVHLQTGDGETVITLPTSAFFEDEGRQFVYVQANGEMFIRREVSLGRKDALGAEVIRGIEPEERVVTKGGYYIKQASQASKSPSGDGHNH